MISTSVTDCWIGLLNIGGLDSSSNTDTNNWRWIDGTHFSYWNWGQGQPDNWKRHESCGEIHGPNRGESSLWNDFDCKSGDLNCFICGNVIAIEPVIATTTIIPTTSTTTTALTTTSSTTATSTTSPITSTSAASNLLPTGGDIALIVLTSIFFLTTVVLAVAVLKICSNKQLHCLDRICCRFKKENTVDTVSNVYETNLGEPEGNNNAMYYDIECETVEPQYSIIMKPVKNQDQRKPDANQISDERFASNEMYS